MGRVLKAPAVDPRLSRGIEFYHRGLFAEAVKAFAAEVRREPENIGARMFLLNALQSAGFSDQSLTMARSMAEVNPRHWSARLARAFLLRGSGDHKGCAKILGVLSRRPESKPAALRESCSLSRDLLARGMVEESFSTWLQMVSHEKEPSLGSLELGREIRNRLFLSGSGPRLWLRGKRRWPAAWRAAQCVELCAQGRRIQDPDVPARGEAAAIDRFQTLLSDGEFSAAFALGERLLDDEPGVDILRRMQLPWEPDRHAGIRERFATYLASEEPLARSTPWSNYYGSVLQGLVVMEDLEEPLRWPRRRYGWMLLWIGRLLLMRQRLPEAVRIFEHAALAKPTDWRAFGWLGETYACLGRWERVEETFERALKAAPAQEKAQVYAWRGALRLWRGDYVRAQRDLVGAAQGRADWAFCWLGGLWTVTGRLPDALEILRHALNLHPSDPEAKLWQGEVLRRLGRFGEALQALEGLPGLWAVVNRALASAAAGDSAGFEKEWARMPADVLARRKADAAATPAVRRAFLEKLLKRARGCRREDAYLQAVWLR